MQLHEMEAWARRVINRARIGGQMEDSLVEFKANWPQPRWAARQLGGHANAARGNPILWVIGCDERQGVVGAPHVEVGDWYAQIKAEFDSGVAPTLIGHPTFELDTHVVTPLVFATDRPPYVVRNPARDTPKSGPFSLDVPWREGTNVRSAGRGELLELLLEQVQLPTIELLRGQVHASRAQDATGSSFLRWSLDLELYMTFLGQRPLVLPFHRMHLIAIPARHTDRIASFGRLNVTPPTMSTRFETRNLSATIEAAADELIVSGSGKIYVRAHSETGNWNDIESQPLVVRSQMYPAGHVLPASFEASLHWAKSRSAADTVAGVWGGEGGLTAACS